jgi:hypothetical protein
MQYGGFIMTNEEQALYDRVKSGELDGMVGDLWENNYGSTFYTLIKDGQIARYKQTSSGRFFNGKENESYGGKTKIVEQWNTIEEILSFLQKYGWLIADAAVNAYSAKFKGKK